MDTFTGRTGTDLMNHTGEQGATWVPHPSYKPGIIITPDDTVYNGTTTRVYVASGTPSSPMYTVEADLIILTNQDHGGIVGRVDPDLDTYYAAEGSSARGIWQLRKRVNGSWTLLKFVDMDFEVGRIYQLRLELRNGSQKFYVDNELILEDDDNDSALRQTGQAGIRLSSDDYHANDPSKGWQLDNFKVTAGSADTTPPAAPANLTAETDAEGVVINLDWDDNTETDLAGYHIYRGEQQGGPYTLIDSVGTTSNFVDSTAPAGLTVYYQVTAVDTSGNHSAPSNEASAARPPDTTPPAVPSSFTAVGTLSGINLDWDDNTETDLAGYRIYRSDQSGGPFTLIAEIGITSSYSDTSAVVDTTHFYQVTAFDTTGNESDPSNEVSATRLDSNYDILYSTNSDRSNPVPLDSSIVSGDIYAFTSPDTPEIVQVRFFVDDPTMSGTPYNVESIAPYDLAGGTTNTAAAFNTLTISNGDHTITAAIDLDNGTSTIIHANFNVDNEDLLIESSPVPGTIQAEDYDEGGSGIGYFDTTTGNTGGAYRNDDVDIQATTDDDGGYNVGWIRTREWLRYTVDIAADGEYTVTLRVATPYTDRSLHLELDDVDISGPVAVSQTGDWQIWADVDVTVQLPAGVHELKIVMDTDSFNLNYFTVTQDG